jgi:hypothetical protein
LRAEALHWQRSQLLQITGQARLAIYLINHDHHHPQTSPGPSGRISPPSTTHLQKTCTTIATPQMKLTIPTDQQLGHQLESIARTIATIIAFVYVAGFTFGQAIYWLSANLTTLHHHLLVNETRHVITHPAATNPDSNHSADYRRTRTTTRAKGFAS